MSTLHKAPSSLLGTTSQLGALEGVVGCGGEIIRTDLEPDFEGAVGGWRRRRRRGQ